MSEWAMKRFWKTVSVEEADGGFAVKLDGRGIKTPAKTALVVPTRAMADVIAEEWDAQDEAVNPLTMPTTRSANAALDKVAVQHAEVADMLAAYGDSDLLCYRADSPSELVERQAAGWDPMLDWAEKTYGARLSPRVGVMHAAQDESALGVLADEVHKMTAFQLAAFHDLVSLSGSLVIALAATQKAQPIETLWSLSRVDETFQEEQWGEDEEAKAVETRKKGEFEHAYRFYHLS